MENMDSLYPVRTVISMFPKTIQFSIETYINGCYKSKHLLNKTTKP